MEAASGPNDVIFVMQSPAHLGPLDGGIQLKDGQKLLGLGPDVTKVPLPAARAMISNSSNANLGGDAVRLANDNEVAGLHITNAHRSGIKGTFDDGSGLANATIHDLLITDPGQGIHPPSPNRDENAIALAPELSGSIHIENVIVDGGDGAGVWLTPVGHAVTDAQIKRVVVKNIRVRVAGITTIPLEHAILNVVIRDCIIDNTNLIIY